AQLDPARQASLMPLFRQGIARAAMKTGALIIDGGTDSGAMALMGQASRGRDGQLVLLGVAPVGKATFPGGPEDGTLTDGAPRDPHPTHFVRAPTRDWAQEAATTDSLVQVLAPSGSPAVTVLVNGGPIAREELLRSVERGSPLVIVEGSGGAADELAALIHGK